MQAFFDTVRIGLFNGKLSQAQVEGLEKIVQYRNRKYPSLSDEALAYILATAYHETAHTMQPIEEYGSQRYLMGKKYWPWIGRGLVQITWKDNYDKFGITNPAQALEWETALHVLFKGMIDGMFRKGHTLDRYFNSAGEDPIRARLIVNGHRPGEPLPDRAKDIASYYDVFLKALRGVKEPVQEVPSTDILETKEHWLVSLLRYLIRMMK